MATKEKDGYQVPKGEEGYIHAELFLGKFNPETGEPEGKPFTQKFSPRDWVNFLEHPLNFKVKNVLHLPAGSPSPEQYAAKKAKKAK